MTRRIRPTSLRLAAALTVLGAASAAPASHAFPWCPADANVDGVVDKLDVPVFLGYWFAGDSSADINRDGRLSVQDVFDFLTVMFNGGCGTPPWETQQ